MMLLPLILLAAGFGLLIKGADWLVDGASSVARKQRISELSIGLTIVAFGTSAPELVVNSLSSIRGLSDITLGNVIGSNILNILLILGVSGLVFPLVVQHKTTWKEIPLSLLAVLILLFLANDSFLGLGDNKVSRIDGIVLLVFFGGFMYYILRSMKAEKLVVTDFQDSNQPLGKSLVYILLGLAGLIIGSKLVIDNAVEIATSLGMSEKLIGLTLVSAGTSLPELVTSVVAAFRKKTDIAVGNVIGSNIFNIFLILGISGIIRPISFSPSFNNDLIVLGLATLFLFIAMFSGKKYKLDRWEAGLLLAAYLAYLFWQLHQAV